MMLLRPPSSKGAAANRQATRLFSMKSAGTPIQGSRVAIIGGSIGGCAAAIALQRTGIFQSVTVFERSPTKELVDRGLGIGLPAFVFKQLVEQDMVDADMRFVETQKRHWVIQDDTYAGHVLYEPEMKVQLHNWGLLWQQLRKRVDDSNYHSGVAIDLDRTKIDEDTSAIEIFRADENNQSLGNYDFCIQADGALSSTTSEKKAQYAGYVLWRGSFSVRDNPHIDLTDMPETFFTPVFKGGHGIFYAMPSTQADDQLINFGVYTRTPPGLEELSRVTRADQVTHEQYEWFQQIALSRMPPRFADMVEVARRDDSIAIHPILDRVPDSFVTFKGRGLLLGDAGAVLRPHTASGTTKALMEAQLLQKLVSQPDAFSWEDVTKAYHQARMEDSVGKVALGERLGEAQVLQTPEWSSMGPSDFEDWLQAQVSDSGNYMYKNLGKK